MRDAHDAGKACAATPEVTLREYIMSASMPKNESEWWAHRRIAKLEAALRAILALSDVDADERSVIARDALEE